MIRAVLTGLFVLLAACAPRAPEPQTLTGRMFGPLDTTVLVLQFDNLAVRPLDFGDGVTVKPGAIQSLVLDGRSAAGGEVIFSGPQGVTPLDQGFVFGSTSQGPEGFAMGVYFPPGQRVQIIVNARFADGRVDPVTVGDLEGTGVAWTFEPFDPEATTSGFGPFLTKTGRLEGTGKSEVGLFIIENS